MKAETVAALDRLNREFYAERGEEFSRTRATPWPSWRRVVDRFLESRPQSPGRHSILDVGCGNGRFASSLPEGLGFGWAYLGIDASPMLAAIARRTTEGDVLVADFVRYSLPFAPRVERFDLVVLFGVLHHVPSWERRRSLLVELAALLRPGGLLAVSFWQFASEERFVRRLASWATCAPEIDRADLEPGDHLLRWGDGDAVRYCHHASHAEAAELTFASGLRRLETFHGDGATGSMNLYHLLRRECVRDVRDTAAGRGG
jgi:SAM-dependent methyltransferase